MKHRSSILLLFLLACDVPAPATPCGPDQGCPDGFHCGPRAYCTADLDADAGAGDALAVDARADAALADAALADVAITPAERGWATVTTAHSPGAIWAPKLAYHAGEQAVFLYGGARTAYGEAVVWLDAMWRYDGDDWSLICESCTGTGRYGHGFVYHDGLDALIVFGGDGPGGLLRSMHVWSAGQWEVVDVDASTPPPLYGFSMVYDRSRDRVVLFGGATEDGSVQGTLYELDGQSWTQRASAMGWPEPRFDEGQHATYDPHSGRVLIFSGNDQDNSYRPRDDFWAWDGATWTELCDPCTGEPHSSVALITDQNAAVTYKMGGYLAGQELSGTWGWDGAAWFAASPDQPHLRDTSGVAHDRARDVIVLYGGNGSGCSGGTGSVDCDETLEFRLSE